MKDKILRALAHIEEKQGVRILFAAEAGSRAWGFESPDSDWDVRFVYVRDFNWYLNITEGRDVLDNYHSMVVGTEFDDPLLDITGWDLRKTFKMLRKSNPQLLEWLASPSIYIDRAAPDLRSAAVQTMRMYPLQAHYQGMAKGNFREYLQGPQVRYKKYLYVIRPLMAATWVREYGSLPPVEFDKILQGVLHLYDNPEELKCVSSKTVAVKRKSNEVDAAPADPVLHSWIEQQLKIKGIDKDYDGSDFDLDYVFRSMLYNYTSDSTDEDIK